ncbi:tetratricopeptide repeat protein [Aurantibacter aestuarii]|uniref:Ion channel protein n=1 Tax=Aurantibacter aestuarii TaxID=1266046 RepID=A0A2T1NDJ2_9FLAO|nr:tetratricopeptide repeat protein [Aurantibacter aestuarii]PSG90508.1 ion channel protein [Aurantibacter aestuarii]
MKYLILYILVFFTTISFSQEDALFDKANTFYKTENYSEAVKTYEQLLSLKKESPELYFNLGNAHYKLNNTAQSIYNYEKALELSPNNKDILQNLAFANNMKVDAFETLPEMGYTKYMNAFSRTFSTTVWSVLAIICSVLFTSALIIYFFTERTQVKRIFFIAGFVLLLFGLFTLGVANYRYNNIDMKTFAIVFSKESKVKTEANFKSEDAFILHEGTKVTVLDTIENWKKIKLSNGKSGWILKNDIKSL